MEWHDKRWEQDIQFNSGVDTAAKRQRNRITVTTQWLYTVRRFNSTQHRLGHLPKTI